MKKRTKLLLYTILFIYSVLVNGQVTGKTTMPSDCNSSDGGINLSVKGGSPPYAFNWSNGATTADLSNISAGNYCVTVTDAFCCEAINCFDVPKPQHIKNYMPFIEKLYIDYKGKQIFGRSWGNMKNGVDDCRYNSGSINNYTLDNIDDKFTVTIVFDKDMDENSELELIQNGVVLGKTKYSPILPLRAFVFNNVALTPGPFSLSGTTVKDKSGNSFFGMTLPSSTCAKIPYESCGQLYNEHNLSLGIDNSYKLHCPNNSAMGLLITDGTFKVLKQSKTCGEDSQIGFDVNYMTTSTKFKIHLYSIDKNGNLIRETTDPDFKNISNLRMRYSIFYAGKYQFEFEADNGCKYLSDIVVVNGPKISAEVQTLLRPCTNQSNGALQVKVFNPIGKYKFSWSNNLGNDVNTDMKSVRDDLAKGIYTVTLTDASGYCKEVLSYELKGADEFELTTNTTLSQPCKDVNNGVISLTTTGGGGGYTYNWSPNASVGIGQNESKQSLPQGLYYVTITDQCGKTNQVACDLRKLFDLNPIVVEGRCENARFTASPINGNLPYTYLWSNGQKTQTATNFSQAICVTVTDAKWCRATKCTNVDNTPSFEIVTTDPCQAVQNGKIEIKINNPDLKPVKVSVLGVPQPIPAISTKMTVEVKDLTDGKYSIVVEIGDCKLSSVRTLVRIPTIKKLDVDASSVSKRECMYTETCNGVPLSTTIKHTESGVREDFCDPTDAGCIRCRYRVLCPDFQNPPNKVSIGGVSGSIKFARHAELEAIAIKILESDPNDPNALRYLSAANGFGFSPCDRITYCTINLRVWLRSQITEIYREPIANTDCVRYKCRGGLFDFLLPKKFTVCQRDAKLPSGYVYNPTITNCRANSFNAHQLFIWRQDLLKMPGFINSELDILLEKIAGDERLQKKAICAKILVCTNDFRVLNSNLDFVDCFESAKPPVVFPPLVNSPPCEYVKLENDNIALCVSKDNNNCDTCYRWSQIPINPIFYWPKYRPATDNNNRAYNILSGNISNTKFERFALFYEEDGFVNPKGIYSKSLTNEEYLADYDLRFYENSNILPLDSMKFNIVDGARQEVVDVIEKLKNKEYILNYSNTSDETEIGWSRLLSSSFLNIRDVKKEGEFTKICGLFNGRLSYNSVGVSEVNSHSSFIISINSVGDIVESNIIEGVNDSKEIIFFEDGSSWGIAAYPYTNQIKVNGIVNEINNNQIFIFDGSIRKVVHSPSVKMHTVRSNKATGQLLMLFSVKTEEGVIEYSGDTHSISPNELLLVNVENNIIRWTKRIHYSNEVNENLDIKFNENNDIYVALTYNESVNIDEDQFNSIGKNDIVILKYNGEGTYLSNLKLGSAEDEIISKLFYNKSILYIAGNMSGEIDRVLGRNHFYKFSGKNTDAFMTYVLDSDFENGTVQSRTTDGKEVSAWVQPNPFSEEFVLKINSDIKGSYNINIVNLLGKTLKSSKLDAYIGENILNIDMNNYNDGIYFIEIVAPKEKKTILKIIKAKQ